MSVRSEAMSFGADFAGAGKVLRVWADVVICADVHLDLAGRGVDRVLAAIIGRSGAVVRVSSVMAERMAELESHVAEPLAAFLVHDVARPPLSDRVRTGPGRMFERRRRRVGRPPFRARRHGRPRRDACKPGPGWPEPRAPQRCQRQAEPDDQDSPGQRMPDFASPRRPPPEPTTPAAQSTRPTAPTNPASATRPR